MLRSRLGGRAAIPSLAILTYSETALSTSEQGDDDEHSDHSRQSDKKRVPRQLGLHRLEDDLQRHRNSIIPKREFLTRTIRLPTKRSALLSFPQWHLLFGIFSSPLPKNLLYDRFHASAENISCKALFKLFRSPLFKRLFIAHGFLSDLTEAEYGYRVPF